MTRRPPAADSPESLARQPDLLVFTAACFALLTGVIEVLTLGVKMFLRRRIELVGADVVWMAPLANLVAFSVPAFVLWLVARRRPTAVSLRVAAFAFAFLGAISLLLMTSLAGYARLLLALGLAVQVSVVISWRPHWLRTLVRLTVGWLSLLRPVWSVSRPTPAVRAKGLCSRSEFLASTGATLLALVAGVRGWQWARESRKLTKLPAASPALPNVLLIVLDTVRAQSLSLHGYARPTTPELERFAKAGVVFERAIATAPWTLTSHASMFTGYYPHDLSARWWTPLDATRPTLAEVLSANGYLTGAFVANLDYCSAIHGLDRGFTHYESFTVSAGQTMMSSSLGRAFEESRSLRRLLHIHELFGRKSAETVNRTCLRWLSRRDERRPFFAFLNYFDAHNPYLPPGEFARRFAAKKPNGYFEPGKVLSPEEIRELNDAYDGSIAYLDHHLGQFLAELRRQGMLDNTLVIITSDHGEQFGDHGGLMHHGNSLYSQLLHVPLVVALPSRIPGGAKIRTPITLRDLAATVVDVTGIHGPAHFPGTSLASHWVGTGSGAKRTGDMLLSEVEKHWAFPAWYPGMKGPLQSLVSDGLHYIKNNGDGSEELYDLENDPFETRDLARSGEGESAVRSLRRALRGILLKS